MKARCALQILFRIRHVFPKDAATAATLHGVLERLAVLGQSTGEVKKDVRTLAQRYQQELGRLFPPATPKPRPQE
jgi:hypothetical protein